MAKTDRPKDLGLGENLSFPATIPTATSSNRSSSPPPKRIKKPKRKLAHLNLDIKKFPRPSPKQLLKIVLVLAFTLGLFLVIKIIYQRLGKPQYPKGILSLTCQSPFSFISRRYQFSKETDCQALRCTYNGTTKEGDLYWCSQGVKENPVACSNKQNEKYTCTAPIGKCEVVRLTTDNNCDSAITYDCSGCETNRNNNLFNFTPQNPFVGVPLPSIPQPPTTSFTFPKSLSEFSRLINQAISLIQVGFSSIKNNQQSPSLP